MASSWTSNVGDGIALAAGPLLVASKTDHEFLVALARPAPVGAPAHFRGLGSVGFGLVTTVSAAGGLAGTLSYGWLTRRISLGDLMRIGLVIETLTHLALAATSSP